VKIKCLIVIALLLSGCSKEDKITQEERIAFALDQLETRINDAKSLLERSPHFQKSVNYEITNYNRGIKALESRSFLDRPVFLYAFFSPGYVEGSKPGCLITWLEEGFTTKGIVIVDQTGKKREYLMFEWPPDLKEWYKRTVMRDAGILLNIKGHWKTFDPNMISDSSSWSTPIELPVDIFHGKIKMGLILKDGSYSEFIDAYIPSSFFEIPPNTSNEGL